MFNQATPSVIQNRIVSKRPSLKIVPSQQSSNPFRDFRSTPATMQKSNVTAHRVPNSKLKSQASQDVYLTQASNSKVELGEPSHVGHQFFRSLAELNRAKFVQNLRNHVDRRVSMRIALTILNSVTDKGRGKIYLQPADSYEWQELTDKEEARSFVFQSLLSLYGAEDTPVGAVIPLPNIRSRRMDDTRSTSPESSPPKKRVRIDSKPPVVLQEQHHHHPQVRRISQKSFDAAKTLALMLNNTCLPQPQPTVELDSRNTLPLTAPSKAHARPWAEAGSASISNPVNETSNHAGNRVMATHRSTPKPDKPTLKRQRRASQNTTTTEPPERITESDISSTDIIVGVSGVGVLDFPNAGNRRFRAMVESKIEIFVKSNRRDMMRMAQVTVKIVHDAGGRFLTLGSVPGLLQEVEREKAWSKTLRTYREFLQKHQREDSMRKLKVAIKHQEMLVRMQLHSPTGHNRVQQMLQEARQSRPVKKGFELTGLGPFSSIHRARAFAEQHKQLTPDAKGTRARSA